ncbi:MAG TPA: hypothetical protein VK501_05370 [Baekduia sp.]|uniref:hypothetical protein n=1 Tax=Baekduia sp. TaxID=2600305 RepID=UPI002B57C2A9|nr:hypothetical protein [Baekduia sp.]HMJ33328.1 hypothetical protein [Baekduia sp.]
MATLFHAPVLLGPVGPKTRPVIVAFEQLSPTWCDGFVTLISNREVGAVAENAVPGAADPLLLQLTADAVDAETSAEATVAPITSTFMNLRDMRSS